MNCDAGGRPVGTSAVRGGGGCMVGVGSWWILGIVMVIVVVACGCKMPLITLEYPGRSCSRRARYN